MRYGNENGEKWKWEKMLAMGFEFDDGVEYRCTQIYGTQLTVPAIKRGYNRSNVLD